MSKKDSKTEQPCTIHGVGGSACRELVECADCGNRHFKDERVEKKKGAWTTYRCPKCCSESYCRI